MYRYQNCEELLLDLKRALVDPQGGFISNGPKVNNVDETVVMDTQEIARVRIGIMTVRTMMIRTNPMTTRSMMMIHTIEEIVGKMAEKAKKKKSIHR